MASLITRGLRWLLRKVEKEPEVPNYADAISLGEGSILLPATKVDFRTGKQNRKYVTVGEKCLLGANFIFETPEGGISIGNNVHITDATFICRTKIEVGDDVTMAWGITLYDHNSHSIYWEERQFDNVNCYNDHVNYNGNSIVNKDWSKVVSKPIKIGNKVWVGYDVTIFKGVEIGEGAVIGAKSVVTKDVPAWAVVAGNPARVVKMTK